MSELKSKDSSTDVGAEIPLPSLWTASFVTENVTVRIVGVVGRV